jgi:hypothetical protein
VNELPIAAQVALWAGCKTPTRHIRNDCLSNASYTAIHYGLGGAMDPAALHTLMLRVWIILERYGLVGKRRPARS